MKRIYLDYHTTAPLSLKAYEAMKPYLEDKWGNYLQPHEEGQRQVQAIQKGFETLQNLLNFDESYTPIFTSSSPEANNQAFHTVYERVIKETGRNHIISLVTEDASIMLPIQELEEKGAHVTWITIDQKGHFDPKDILNAITPRTSLISFALAHGLTGVYHDELEEIQKVCKLRKIYFHLDLSYAFGKLETNVGSLGADLISLGGDLLFGPKSSGLLLVKEPLIPKALILGDLSQSGLRSGPFDTASFMGFVKACEESAAHLGSFHLETARLRNFFEKKVKEKISNTEVLFTQSSRLPNVAVLAFSKVHADSLLYALNQRGVSATMGGGAFQKLSHLLERLGYSQAISHTAISFALSKETTKEEIEQVIGILQDEVSRLRLGTQQLEVAYEN